VTENNERRSHPRVETEVAGHIVGHKGHESIALQIYNMSCSGFYCRLPMFVAPFTRLQVVMFMPTPDKGGDGKQKVEFDGVVVRTDPEQESPDAKQYHLAIFFDGLTDEKRVAVERYVQEHDAE